MRLDSGDLLELSKQVRQILDDAGMSDTKIFASGDLNEYRIRELINRGARIDSFGVGTELATSYDAPALSGVYKLAALEKNGQFSMRIKLSHDKETYPGPKQVWRFSDETGRYTHDLIALADEARPCFRDGLRDGFRDGERQEGSADSCRPLLELVMEEGCVVERVAGERSDVGENSPKNARWTALNQARERARMELKSLPAELLALDSEASYSAAFSNRLVEERENLERRQTGL